MDLGIRQVRMGESEIGAGESGDVCISQTHRTHHSLFASACKSTGIGQPESYTKHHSLPPFDKPFDVIFGADIVYELSHASLVHDVVERLLRRPSYGLDLPPAYFHLIMPLRPTHADEATSVDKTFPRAEDVLSGRLKEGGEAGEVLAIVGAETYARSAGVGRADEVQYVYYRMAWV